MNDAITRYDEISDSLTITFSSGEVGTGIELNDHILLRLNKVERRPIGLTFFEYSVLAQRTEIGPRSFPLTGIDKLSPELRDLALEIIQSQPVSEILSQSAYTPSTTETIPIVSIRTLPIVLA